MAVHTAHRILQQANVYGIMNIGFNDKRITAPPQGLARFFAHDRMAALHDQLVDLPTAVPDKLFLKYFIQIVILIN